MRQPRLRPKKTSTWKQFELPTTLHLLHQMRKQGGAALPATSLFLKLQGPAQMRWELWSRCGQQPQKQTTIFVQWALHSARAQSPHQDSRSSILATMKSKLD